MLSAHLPDALTTLKVVEAVANAEQELEVVLSEPGGRLLGELRVRGNDVTHAGYELVLADGRSLVFPDRAALAVFLADRANRPVSIEVRVGARRPVSPDEMKERLDLIAFVAALEKDKLRR